MCPEHFRLKYDGNSFTFSVRYPGKSKYQLIQDKIISDAGENPMFLGMFVANAQHFEEPAPAFETGFTYFRVLDQPPLTSDEFDDKYLDPTMWTSYNPDAANMKVEEDKGALNVYYPEGNQHHMWHKPAVVRRTVMDGTTHIVSIRI